MADGDDPTMKIEIAAVGMGLARSARPDGVRIELGASWVEMHYAEAEEVAEALRYLAGIERRRAERRRAR